MGLADFGLSSSGPYAYDTSSFEAALSLQSFSAFSPGYASFENAPNWASFSLDTVAINISYPSATNGVFWAQNIARFNGTEFQLEDNLWNFSSPGGELNQSTLLSYGGTFVPRAFYFDFGREIAIRAPFSLHLFNNVTILGGHPAIFFNYSLTNGSGRVAGGSFDHVVFNGPANASRPPQFQVNGTAYNPYRSLYDAEFVLVGDGGGANANVLSLNATETLAAWNSSAGAYRSIRSAYDFGADTAESGLGVGVYYLGTTAYLNQGPSLLYGLWNTTATPFAPSATVGWVRVGLNVNPDYGFVFATYQRSLGSSLAADNLSYAPSNATGAMVAYLPPPPGGNPYVFWAWADGYLNQSVSITGNVTGLQPLNLTASTSATDAPIYLVGDAQAANFGRTGIASVGYAALANELWINASSWSLAAPFLRLNDFGYPTFVLLATDRLDTSVLVNAFVQDPASFVYTSSSHLQGWVPKSIPGWTQGYYFFYGNGSFSVSNVAVMGNFTADSAAPALYPPGAIEFYRTHGSQAANINTAEDSPGVDAIGGHGLTFAHISAATGASGIAVINSSSVVGTDILSTGTGQFDGFPLPSTAVDLFGTTGVTLTTLTTSLGANGVTATNGSGLTIHGLSATGGATGLTGENQSSLNLTGATVVDSTGILLNNTSGATLENVTVGSGSFGFGSNNSTRIQVSNLSVAPTASAGEWSNSTQMTVDNIEITRSEFPDSELMLDRDSFVTVQGINATGEFTTAVQFSNSTHGSFSKIEASDGAVGVAFGTDQLVNVEGVQAYNGSVGVSLSKVVTATATNLTAAGESVGLVWANGSIGSIAWANVSAGSVGAYVSNVTHVSIASFNGTESSLAPFEFLNNATGLTFPTAVVATANDTLVNVSGVYSVSYPCTVWDSGSINATVARVESWYGNFTVMFNNTTGSAITSVFAYGGESGVLLQNTTSSSLNDSTLEGSAGGGLVVLNGTGLTVRANNFLANNGSSTNGNFKSNHVQVWVVANSTSRFAFGGNYWADRSSSTYGISSRFKDLTPLTAPVPYWLRFVAHGLSGGQLWGFTYLSIAYRSTQPVVYLPDWTLPTGLRTFVVGPAPAGYTYLPLAGNVTFSPGSNTTETINFTGPPASSPSGLTTAEYAGIGVAVVLVAVLLVLLLRRRAPKLP